MTIGSIGSQYDHDNSFVFDSPEGPGSVLLLLVSSSAMFTINGREEYVKPGSLVILDWNTPCRYTSAGNGYTDDWIFIDCDPEEKHIFAELGLEFDKVFHLGNIDELTRLVHMMTVEHYSALEHSREAGELYLRLLLIMLSRRLNNRSMPGKRDLPRNSRALTRVRARIYTEPDKIEGVDQLAQEVNMSRSGLQHAYKRLFGVSVMEDMISGRIEMAKMLLSSTGMTLEAISVRCGYSSVYAFMRQFRARVGMTAAVYRRSRVGEDNILTGERK